MNFEKWLKTQKHRDDRVGDLAKDYINSRMLIRSPYASKSDDRSNCDIIVQMRAWNACFDAWDSLEEAIEEHAKIFPDARKILEADEG
jgi:hypothetical protein